MNWRNCTQLQFHGAPRADAAGISRWFLVVTLLVALCNVAVPTRAQTLSFAKQLQEKLDQYNEARAPHTLAMYFNQPAYVAGDTAWFSVWLVSERQGRGVMGRRLINVEMWATAGEAIIRQKILVHDGMGKGQLILPRKLPAGIYTVVSWADGMPVQDPSLFYYSQLVVTGDRQYSGETMPLAAYPEGGGLAGSSSNRVVITGTPGELVTLYSDNDVVASAQLDAEGYGQIEFDVQEGKSYRVSDRTGTAALGIKPRAVALTVNMEDDASTFSVRLAAHDRTEAYDLAIISRGKVVYAAMVNIREGEANIVIPKKTLPEGLLLISVFDGKRQLVAERLFIARFPESSMTIQSARPVVYPREKVQVKIQAQDMDAPLTVNVYAEGMFMRHPSVLVNSLVLPQLPRSGIDFTIRPDWTLKKWNVFLATQKWNRFVWTEVWDGVKPHDLSLGRYLRFNGRVVLPPSTPEFDSLRITFFLKREARVYEASVSPNGMFDFLLFFDFDEREEVTYTIDRKGKILKDATIELNQEMDHEFVLPPVRRQTVVDPYAGFALFRDTTRSIYANYFTELREPDDPNSGIEEELFESDIAVNLDDYVSFPDMEETLREIIPRLQHRWRNKRHSVRVYLTEPDILATGEPLYFIDGVLTDDTDYFMELKPQDVATIKIVSTQRKLTSMGILGKNGIVLVTTKIRDNHLRVPHTRKSFMAVGIARPFPHNNDPGTSPHTPLLRSSLFFDTELKLNEKTATIEFIAPDNVGPFRIDVVGFSRQGKVQHSTVNINVVRPTITP